MSAHGSSNTGSKRTGGMASDTKTPANAGVGETNPPVFDAQGAIGKQFTGEYLQLVVFFHIVYERNTFADDYMQSKVLWEELRKTLVDLSPRMARSENNSLLKVALEDLSSRRLVDSQTRAIK